MQFTGKTVEEATEKGLAELNLKKEDAEIAVVEEAVKGLFGKIKKEAVVEIVKKTEKKKAAADKVYCSIEEVRDFVQEMLDKMNITAKAVVKEGKDAIEIVAENPKQVVGFKGECLDAIQTLAGAKYNVGRKDYAKLVVDCENYREKREETLIALAHKLENKATEMRRDVVLEPMNPFERRIIHTALSESETVKTRSEGTEPNRYIVITPNDKDEFSRPYNAGRNNGRNDNRRERNDRHGRNDRRDNHGSGNGRKSSGFSEEKRKKSGGFGTYLGNSLKD
ncbi:MAG: protein jag [Clostridia bacterium]|nr:protein jag [Clostridia bacterium]